ncbi:MAG: hypothetical protein GXY90_10035 [Peptococcaceae bacterium]|jgi:ssDNA-binding Zn-finger/Zn-ribbon topoisomerase 1|nr:hypothetical protein [Peptococcaceae bacterium]
MIEKRGKFGAFLGCLRYPDCRYIENISRYRRIESIG